MHATPPVQRWTLQRWAHPLFGTVSTYLGGDALSIETISSLIVLYVHHAAALGTCQPYLAHIGQSARGNRPGNWMWLSAGSCWCAVYIRCRRKLRCSPLLQSEWGVSLCRMTSQTFANANRAQSNMQCLSHCSGSATKQHTRAPRPLSIRCFGARPFHHLTLSRIRRRGLVCPVSGYVRKR